MLKKVVQKLNMHTSIVDDTNKEDFPQINSDVINNLFCNECGSRDIVESDRGFYTCENCGLVIEDLRVYSELFASRRIIKNKENEIRKEGFGRENKHF